MLCPSAWRTSVGYSCVPVREQQGGQEQRGAKHGAHVTLQGVACAEGKRKTSRAVVGVGEPGWVGGEVRRMRERAK